MFRRQRIVDANHQLFVIGGNARGNIAVRFRAALHPAAAMHVDQAVSICRRVAMTVGDDANRTLFERQQFRIDLNFPMGDMK